MRHPPPGTLESVAEEISASSSSATLSSSSTSSQRYYAPHRSSVSSSEAECVTRSFATAAGAFVVAFSAGIALQVELARRIPARFRGFTSAIPVAAALFSGVETYRFLSERCAAMNRRRGAFGSGSYGATSGRRRPSSAEDNESNFSGLLARRVREFSSRRLSNFSSAANSTECASASSALPSSVSSEEQLCDQRQPQQHRDSLPQIPVWNHITETPIHPSPAQADNSFNLIPGLP